MQRYDGSSRNTTYFQQSSFFFFQILNRELECWELELSLGDDSLVRFSLSSVVCIFLILFVCYVCAHFTGNAVEVTIPVFSNLP
jgi:hypothetical protein